MLVYAGLPSYGAREFVDIPDQYVIDKCGCICLLFCNHLGEFTVIVLAVWVNVSACYQIYSNVQRVFPLTVDSLLSPGTLSLAFVILINYYAPKISNENPTYIYICIYLFLIIGSWTFMQIHVFVNILKNGTQIEDYIRCLLNIIVICILCFLYLRISNEIKINK